MRVKHSKTIITLSLTIITLGLLSISSASALTYQSPVDMQFTFSPTVQIAVSGDLIIPDLAPGSSSDSNIITITAGSNDVHGYKLYGTVGSSTNNYTDLRLSSSNTTNVFTNLSSNKATLANFSDNTWGYSYSTDSGSTWKSGNAGSTSSGYNGLPLYNSSNNASGIILASTNNASETSLKFKIGAKASSTQASGTYTNTINFIGVGKVVTTTYNLNYNANAGSDTVTGMPTNLTGETTNNGVIALSETTPTREGYIFKGWCTDNSSETECSGTIYESGRIYVIPVANQGTTTTINLYAIWQTTTGAPINLAGTSWYFGEDIDMDSFIASLGYGIMELEGISNGRSFTYITTNANHYFMYGGPMGTAYTPTSGWTDEGFRTVTFTGGENSDNELFIQWLSSNATQL